MANPSVMARSYLNSIQAARTVTASKSSAGQCAQTPARRLLTLSRSSGGGFSGVYRLAMAGGERRRERLHEECLGSGPGGHHSRRIRPDDANTPNDAIDAANARR